MSLDEFLNILQSPTVEGHFLRGMTGVIFVTILGIIMGIVGLIINLSHKDVKLNHKTEEKTDV